MITTLTFQQIRDWLQIRYDFSFQEAHTKTVKLFKEDMSAKRINTYQELESYLNERR